MEDAKLQVVTRAVELTTWRGKVKTGKHVLESKSLIRSLQVIRDASDEEHTINNLQKLIDMIYDVDASV